MKKLLLAVFCFSSLLLSAADGTYFLVVRYTFEGIESGYDHKNKIIVYVDGKKAGESTPELESVENGLRLKVKAGTHTVKVENWVEYKGEWELHSKENEYSFDLIDTETIDFDGHKTLKLLYDLDKGSEVSVE